uniref:Uncharacterized protein n=1 Tax=Acrobeloides nanus TaxID=290746 RepID=A0A914E3E4_9BILA
MKTMEEWNAEAEPNIPIGALYASIGILCEIIYIPFMIVMLRPEFFQYSCYKFMFLLGVIDMIVLPGNSIISGIQCMLGYHYCNNPRFYFITGAIANCVISPQP